MSNKKIPSTESVSTVDQDSSVLNGTTTSPLKSSPLFGWLYPTFRIKFRNKSLGIMCQVHQ